MPLNLFQLREQYGALTLIPDNIFYEYIDRDSTRELQKAFLEATPYPEVLQLDGYTESAVKRDLREIWLARQETRRRFRADLFFLAKFGLHATNPECIGKPIAFSLFNERTHRPIADFFIKKDWTKSFAQQEGPERAKERKYRLLLYPRGSMKSTWDIADTVQWILCFPEIRILFLTATDDLAVKFLQETKGHFIKHEYTPTLMQLYFPDFCVDPDDRESQFEFTCPVWAAKKSKRGEPTVMAKSVGTNLAGFHVDAVKCDDSVSERNSENDVQCQKTSNKIVMAQKLVMPYGVIDFIGTRYADLDHYGVLLSKNVGTHITKIKDSRPEPLYNPCWEQLENADTGMKILIGRAWQLKPDIKVKVDNGELTFDDLKEEHYDYLFPEYLSYRFLHKELEDNELIFEGQYNQNPRPTTKADIPRSLLLKSTVVSTDMPFRGPITQTWDFAFSTRKERDYTTACNALWDDKGRMFINDMIRARFKPNDLAQAVVDFARKWKPMVVGIEDIGGSKLLEPTIIAKAKETGIDWLIAVCSRIDWIKAERDQDAKRTRMGALQPWLVNGTLKFANYLPFLDVLYDEFEICLRKGHHHNDIPDVISRQVKYAPSIGTLVSKKEMVSWTPAEAWYNLTFVEGTDPWGRIGYGSPSPPPISVVNSTEDEAPPPNCPSGMDNILGAGCGWG